MRRTSLLPKAVLFCCGFFLVSRLVADAEEPFQKLAKTSRKAAVTSTAGVFQQAAQQAGATLGAQANDWVDAWVSNIDEGNYMSLDMDPDYQIIERVMGGESGFNILNEHFANPELEQVFAVPTYAKAIFEGLPMTQALNGVKELFDKADDFAPEDGLNFLNILRNFLITTSKTLETVQDSKGFATMLKKYAETEDEVLQALYAKVESGDSSAVVELQQKIIDQEMGPFVNLKALGFDGNEPEWAKAARQRMFNTPGLSDYLNADPETARWLKDDNLALKIAKMVVSEQSSTTGGGDAIPQDSGDTFDGDF